MSEKKKSKVAQHFTDYRDAYIVGAVLISTFATVSKSGTTPSINLDNSAKLINTINMISKTHPGKVVNLLDEAGNIVASYASLTEAEKLMGASRAVIKRMASNDELYKGTYKVVINRLADSTRAAI